MEKDLSLTFRNKGVVELGKTISDEACIIIRQFIDGYSRADAELNYGGSEKRIWDAEKRCPQIREFAEYANEVASKQNEKKMRCYTVLAYQNSPCDVNKFGQGRWHCDSLVSQTKVFNFLSPVSPDNGPLEILLETHLSRFKILGLLTGSYISPSDFLVGETTRKYQRIDEKYIRLIRRLGIKTRKITTEGSGESFLVDTSALHRARPLLSGARYALCAYFRH